MVCWGSEEEPLEIPPLAMVEPCVGTTEAPSAVMLEASVGFTSKSEWVMETLTEFGPVLEASFEGFEVEMTKIVTQIST